MRGLVIGAVVASTGMVALEATIVSTAMPQIVAQLGGLRLYAWVFAAFLLTQTAMTVVFGKLADIFGRRPVMFVSIGVFVAGSVLAGFAWSMPSMIAFRLIQGIGAGGMMPVAMTIVADLYPARERGKIQGYLSSVWAISAVLGPLAGGIIVNHLSWAWIFWINVPVGLVAALLFLLFLHEQAKHERRSIDVGGAILFTLSVAALMIALTQTESTTSSLQWIAGGVFAVCLVLFLVQETYATDPMVSFRLWRRRPIAAANGAAMISGVALIGLTTFLPMFVQAVLHRSPVTAGLALTMIMLGWPVGATTAARTFPRFGLRRILIVGSLMLPLGASMFVLLGPGSSPVLAGLGSLVMGVGMGLMSTASIVTIQEIVDWSQRGSATASNLFARNLGSTLGAAALGAVLNYGLSHAGVGAVTSDQLRRTIEAPPGSGNDALALALGHSLHATFWAILIASLGSVAMASIMPRIEIAPAPRAKEVPAEQAAQ